MFGIGTGELVIIFLILLLVLGPREAIEIARKLGRVLRNMNRVVDEVLSIKEVESEPEEKS